VGDPKEATKGRDAKTERFLTGNDGGPGRPAGLDFRRIVVEGAEAAGIPLEAAVWSIFTSLRQARDRDIQAAKPILDRLCGDREVCRATPPRRQMAVRDMALAVRAAVRKVRSRE